ncbi:MAG: ATP-binding protein [Myxococcus sp.]|nr:ATP-binding protein [Myxococcus sp.]
MSSPRACETSGYSVQRQGDFATASVTQNVRDCADCGGTGLLRATVNENGRTYDVVEPCPRARMVARAAAFSSAHLPAVHAQASFDTFRPSNVEQARAVQLAREFSAKYPQTRGFVLSGPVGTGKTHLLCATLKHLALELGARVAYVEISLLYAQIRRGFQDGKSGGEIIQPLSQVDVLAIDELGKGRGSAFELDTLDELIARRYNSGRVTLFATNYSLKSPEDRAQRGYLGTDALVDASKESKLLADRVGDRIYSRLCEMCEFVEFPGNTADQRRTKTVSGNPNGPPRR